jgi:anti-sigma factor RsiW
MKCAEANAFIHAYVDGELAGLDRNAYEQHLLECDQCSRCCRLQARFKAAVRGHLHRREVTEGLRRRIEQAIAFAPPPPRRWRWQLYPKFVPVVLVLGATAAVIMTTRAGPSLATQQAMRTFSAAMPMDVVNSSCALVADWFRGRVGFPVKPPPEAVGARCEGGRLVVVGDRVAAYLSVRVLSGHKLAVMVFDGTDDEIDGPVRKVVKGMEIRLTTQRGASSAAFRGWDGLNYVLTGDLDADSLTNFATAAYRTY